MRERINRLARGIIDNGSPELVLTPERVEASVPAGEVIRGEILVSSGNNLHIKGLVYSSHERVRVVNGALAGFATGLYMKSTWIFQSMGTKSRDLFTWSPMAVRGRFLILCAYRPAIQGRFWET